jgi:hypothetical protein
MGTEPPGGLAETTPLTRLDSAHRSAINSSPSTDPSEGGTRSLRRCGRKRLWLTHFKSAIRSAIKSMPYYALPLRGITLPSPLVDC